VATEDLVMLDERQNEDDKMVAVVLSDNCIFNQNVVTIPADEALSIVANIAIQLAVLQ